jgi:hypothetical protein
MDSRGDKQGQRDRGFSPPAGLMGVTLARRQVMRHTPTASQPSSRRLSTRRGALADAGWSDVAPGWINIVAPKIY